MSQLAKLRAECLYDDEGGFDEDGNDLGSVDALIEYKNALEDYASQLEAKCDALRPKAGAWSTISRTLDANGGDRAARERWGGTPSAADVCAVGFELQEKLKARAG